MSIHPTTADPELLSSRVRVPRHVVHRAFPAETVVLNLETGQYHGLNPIAGRMLKTLESAPSIAAAVLALQAEFPDAAGQIEDDVCVLCRALATRGLILLERGLEH